MKDIKILEKVISIKKPYIEEMSIFSTTNPLEEFQIIEETKHIDEIVEEYRENLDNIISVNLVITNDDICKQLDISYYRISVKDSVITYKL